MRPHCGRSPVSGDCDTAIGGLATLSNEEIFLKSELFSNDGKKKFVAKSSGHFKEAKKIGYKVGAELLKKAGSNFTKQEEQYIRQVVGKRSNQYIKHLEIDGVSTKSLYQN